MAGASSILDLPGSHTAPLRRVSVVGTGSLLSNASSGMTAPTTSTMLLGKKLADCGGLSSTMARTQTGDSVALQFLVVGDPRQLKDKARLKAIRQHVMHKYLEKERQKPSSSDIRITKAGNSRKRRKVQTTTKGRVSDLGGHTSSNRSSSLSAVHHTSSHTYSAPELPTRLNTGENTEMTTTTELRGLRVRKKKKKKKKKEARKWLAAVTVRCSIVLSFEYGEVILATLRRLVGIQQVLRRGKWRPVLGLRFGLFEWLMTFPECRRTFLSTSQILLP
ncbi:hypothetical protein Slin14017_G012020 [Septoria linicola]|nr:hypothetical protein Slin14017_G012020 [Septoria linicola]